MCVDSIAHCGNSDCLALRSQSLLTKPQVAFGLAYCNCTTVPLPQKDRLTFTITGHCLGLHSLTPPFSNMAPGNDAPIERPITRVCSIECVSPVIPSTTTLPCCNTGPQTHIRLPQCCNCLPRQTNHFAAHQSTNWCSSFSALIELLRMSTSA